MRSLIVIFSLFSLIGCNTDAPQEDFAMRTTETFKQADGALKNPGAKYFQDSRYIKGVNSQQWSIIEDINDPQNCWAKIRNLKNLVPTKFITHEEFANNKNIINEAMGKHKVVALGDGLFDLEKRLNIEGRTLIGSTDTVLNAAKVHTAIRIKDGNLKNVSIHNSKVLGIQVQRNSNIQNVIVKNTGLNNPTNEWGYGLAIEGNHVSNVCVVSVEAAFGSNQLGDTPVQEKGGNADGFSVKHGANQITFIDSHAHHNTDDGFDFWMAGELDQNASTINIFFSSANHNGKHPTRENGDGNGFKLGSTYSKHGSILTHGSVSCFNLQNGFDDNDAPRKLFFSKVEAKGNGKTNITDKAIFVRGYSNENRLTCSMFPRK